MSTPIYTKPDYSSGVWAFEGDIGSPSEDKIAQGHVVERPPFEISNFIENRQDQGIAYLFQQGISEWDGNLSYPIGALVKRSGMIYKALAVNTDEDPTLNTTIWERAFFTYNEALALQSTVTSITGTDEFLDFYVSKSNPRVDGRFHGHGYLADRGVPITLENNVGYAFDYNFTGSQNISGLFHDGDSPVMLAYGWQKFKFSDALTTTDNDDCVVTMSVLKSMLSTHEAYKVGDIYITTSSMNPSVRFGYGTWERYAKGMSLVGYSDEAGNPNWTRTVGMTYGEYEHKLTEAEMPIHNHNNGEWSKLQIVNGLNTKTSSDSTAVEPNLETVKDIVAKGGDLPHNNVQPSIVVYMWRRIA